MIAYTDNIWIRLCKKKKRQWWCSCVCTCMHGKHGDSLKAHLLAGWYRSLALKGWSKNRRPPKSTWLVPCRYYISWSQRSTIKIEEKSHGSLYPYSKQVLGCGIRVIIGPPPYPQDSHQSTLPHILEMALMTHKPRRGRLKWCLYISKASWRTRTSIKFTGLLCLWNEEETRNHIRVSSFYTSIHRQGVSQCWYGPKYQ